MTKSIVLVIGLLIFSNVRSQGVLLDSVNFDLGQNREIQITATNFHKIEKWGSLDSIYDLFINDLGKLEGSVLNAKGSNSLTYQFSKKNRTIKVNSDVSVVGEVSIDKDGNVIYFQKVEFVMNNDDRLWVKSPDMQGFYSIADLNLDSIVNQGDEYLSPNGRRKGKHKVANLTYANGQLVDSTSEIISVSTDLIELGMNFGVGTLRSTITPDVEFNLLVGLSQKGRLKHSFGLLNQWLFSFPVNESGETYVKTEGFLDGVYLLTVKRESDDKERILGIKAGTLVTPNPVNFENNAYRAALLKSITDNFVVEGGFYMIDNFSEYFPYARISWTW